MSFATPFVAKNTALTDPQQALLDVRGDYRPPDRSVEPSTRRVKALLATER